VLTLRVLVGMSGVTFTGAENLGVWKKFGSLHGCLMLEKRSYAHVISCRNCSQSLSSKSSGVQTGFSEWYTAQLDTQEFPVPKHDPFRRLTKGFNPYSFPRLPKLSLA